VDVPLFGEVVGYGGLVGESPLEDLLGRQAFVLRDIQNFDLVRLDRLLGGIKQLLQEVHVDCMKGRQVQHRLNGDQTKWPQPTVKG